MTELQLLNSIEIESGILYIDNDILCLIIKKDAELDVELVKEGLDLRVKLQKGKPMLCMVDSSEMNHMSREARAYIGKFEKENNLNLALGIVAKSLSTRLIANFFIKFNKPHAPTKVFNTREEAIFWLNGFK